MICARVAGVPRPRRPSRRAALRRRSSCRRLPWRTAASLPSSARRTRLLRLDHHVVDTDGFARFDRHEAGCHGFALGFRLVIDQRRFLAVHRQPAGVHQYLALGLECFALDPRDARRDLVFGRREEHRQKAARDHVVDLRFRFRQRLRLGAGRDDCEVIRNLCVVEDALVRLHPAMLDDFVGMRNWHRCAAGAPVRHSPSAGSPPAARAHRYAG
jgi:hypothetical protein